MPQPSIIQRISRYIQDSPFLQLLIFLFRILLGIASCAFALYSIAFSSATLATILVTHYDPSITPTCKAYCTQKYPHLVPRTHCMQYDCPQAHQNESTQICSNK